MTNYANDESPDIQQGVTEQTCCGKWTFFDPRDAKATCACGRPAADEAVLDAFLDDYSALFRVRVAA